jgi:hypothetical protein
MENQHPKNNKNGNDRFFGLSHGQNNNQLRSSDKAILKIFIRMRI